MVAEGDLCPLRMQIPAEYHCFRMRCFTDVARLLTRFFFLGSSCVCAQFSAVQRAWILASADGALRHHRCTADEAFVFYVTVLVIA